VARTFQLSRAESLAARQSSYPGRKCGCMYKASMMNWCAQRTRECSEETHPSQDSSRLQGYPGTRSFGRGVMIHLHSIVELLLEKAPCCIMFHNYPNLTSFSPVGVLLPNSYPFVLCGMLIPSSGLIWSLILAGNPAPGPSPYLQYCTPKNKSQHI
jgi:hypothetical protein